MPQIDSPCQRTVRGVLPTGVPVRSPLVEGAGLLGLLLCVLPSLIGCHVNGPYPVSKVGDPGTFVESEADVFPEKVHYEFDCDHRSSKRQQSSGRNEASGAPAEDPRVFVKMAVGKDEPAEQSADSVCADWASASIHIREVEPTSEPVEPADRTAAAQEEPAAERLGSTSDTVAGPQPDGDQITSVTEAINILKGIDKGKQRSEPERGAGTSVTITGEFDLPDVAGVSAAAADSADGAPVSMAAHLQKLEQDEDAAAMLQPIEPSADEGEEALAAQAVDDPDKRSVTEITTDVLPKADDKLPPNQALDEGKFLPSEMATEGTCTGRGWSYCMYQWEASGLYRRPLYFEEVNIERYGYSRFPAAQPAVSAARFFATVCTLPYQMTAQPPREHVYTLGYYRPGSCAPYQIHRPPLEPKAGAVEAGVIAGLIFAVP